MHGTTLKVDIVKFGRVDEHRMRYLFHTVHAVDSAPVVSSGCSMFDKIDSANEFTPVPNRELSQTTMECGNPPTPLEVEALWTGDTRQLAGGVGAADAPSVQPHGEARAPKADTADLAQPFASGLISGWRDLRFGMSEAEVRKLLLKYRKTDAPWEKFPKTSFPLIRLKTREITEHSYADEKRFQHWGISDLDDADSRVNAWFEQGKLIGVEASGKISQEAFLERATAAYGVQPKTIPFEFFNEITTTKVTRDVAYWRGTDATAFLWSTGDSPRLWVWSIAPMEASAAKYQESMDRLMAPK